MPCRPTESLEGQQEETKLGMVLFNDIVFRRALTKISLSAISLWGGEYVATVRPTHCVS